MRIFNAVLLCVIAATMTLYTGFSSPNPIDPDEHPGLTGKVVCRDLLSLDGALPAASLLSPPPQSEAKGCCVLKIGPQSGWQYIFTTAGNCTRLARNAKCPHSFYPDTQCERLRPR